MSIVNAKPKPRPRRRRRVTVVRPGAVARRRTGGAGALDEAFFQGRDLRSLLLSHERHADPIALVVFRGMERAPYGVVDFGLQTLRSHRYWVRLPSSTPFEWDLQETDGKFLWRGFDRPADVLKYFPDTSTLMMQAIVPFPY